MEIRDGDDSPVTLNPLLIPEILEHIFTFCKIKDLKSYRLVSRLWHENSLKIYRSSVHLKIRSSWIGSHPNGTSMSTFLEFIENEDKHYLSTQFPYNFSVYDDNKTFWTISGHLIKILTLNMIEFRSPQDFRNAVFNCCPNLEQLTLWFVSFAKQKEEDKDKQLKLNQDDQQLIIVNKNLKSISLSDVFLKKKITWMELLSHFPSLEALTLDAAVTNPNELVKSIRTIRDKDPTKLKLSLIDTWALNTPLSSTNLLCLLSDSDLQLETITIDITSYSKEDASTLAQVLNVHSSSLKKLLLLNEGTNLSSFIFDYNFPSKNQKILENLQELELSCPVFSSLRFLKLTPHLKKLVIEEGSVDLVRSTTTSDMNNVRLFKCKELELDLPNLLIEDLEKLISWFPEVRKLKMSLNNEQLSLICERCPNLVELEVLGDQIDDCGLTGLDIEDVEVINLEGTGGNWRPITVPRANIASLKYLRSLYLNARDTDVDDLSPRLGYCAADSGIKNIPNLIHLRIEDYQLEIQDLWSHLLAQFPWRRNE